VVEGRDGRKRCATIAFLAEALGAPGMNQVAEFSGESRFRCGVCLDDAEVGCYFREFVEVPPLEVCIRLPGEFSTCPESCDGGRDIPGWMLLKRPEEKGFDRGAGENSGGLPLTVR
jgi:hypothetical protein